MIDAVRRYLELLKSASGPIEDRLRALASTLDGLLCAYHATPDEFVEGAIEPPKSDDYLQRYKMAREVASRTFPEFGLYAVVMPESNPNAQPMLGDALDDLTDIALDMENVLWRFENGDPRDAAWHFRFGYQSHWGRHLLDLRSYVHHLQFE
jgi:hypothetical protein